MLFPEYAVFSFNDIGDNGFENISFFYRNPSTFTGKGLYISLKGNIEFYSFLESKYIYDSYNNRVGVRGTNISRNFYMNFQNLFLAYSFKNFNLGGGIKEFKRNLFFRQVEYVNEFGKVDSIVNYGYDTLEYGYNMLLSYSWNFLGFGIEGIYTGDFFISGGISYQGSTLRSGLSYIYPLNILFIHLSYRVAASLPTIGSVSLLMRDGSLSPGVGIAHYFYPMDAKLSYGFYITEQRPGLLFEFEKSFSKGISTSLSYKVDRDQWEEGDNIYEEVIHGFSMGIKMKWQ